MAKRKSDTSTPAADAKSAKQKEEEQLQTLSRGIAQFRKEMAMYRQDLAKLSSELQEGLIALRRKQDESDEIMEGGTL